MRVRSVVFVSLLLVSACTSATPPAPAAPAASQPQVVGTLNQVMRGILFPNSNIIFDTQDKDPAADPDPNDPTSSVHAFAGTYGKWEAVENAAIALSEAANLISMPGRTCANGKPVPLQDETYQKGLAALRDIAARTYKEAQAKNKDAMLDISDKMTQACATCHDVYRDKVVNGQPIGIADRCVQ
jgi:hypothetical protein